MLEHYSTRMLSYFDNFHLYPREVYHCQNGQYTLLGIRYTIMYVHVYVIFWTEII